MEPVAVPTGLPEDSYLFVSPISGEALGCPVGSADCPGAMGELLFDPPIISHVEVPCFVFFSLQREEDTCPAEGVTVPVGPRRKPH